MLGKIEFLPNDYAISPEIYDQSLPQITTSKAILTDFLNKHPLNGQETVLDFGCGTGLLAEYAGTLLSTGQVIGLDCASNMIQFAKKHHASEKVSFEIEDLTQFNPRRKKSADLILCSWVISHIPIFSQKTIIEHFFKYLKKDGKLFVIFPVMGSELATTINEVANSTEWISFFEKSRKTRVSYSTEEFDRLLIKAGFINRDVQTRTEKILFKTREELDCYITTAVARYLPCLEETAHKKFIQTISDKYCLKMGVSKDDIPYSVTLLIATAQRPVLDRSFIKHEDSATTNKDYLANHQYKGTVHFQHRIKIFDYGTNLDLREWEAHQYTGVFNLNNCSTILETGCGDGKFWKYAIPTISASPSVILTDLSETMLSACSSQLNKMSLTFPVQYLRADMDNLPFAPNQFNAILAHNVIYHSENPDYFFHTINDLLTQEGFLGLSVLNHDVNERIWSIAHDVNEAVPAHSFTFKFSDREADKFLPLFFSKIEKRPYKNQLHFKESEPIVNMVRSSPVVQSLNLPGTFFNSLQKKIDTIISEEGELVSEFNASFYLCQK